MNKLRILLADDHDVVRRGIRCLLEERPDWVVCGEARTGREAFARVNDEAAMSSVGSELGQALYAQGRFDEAADWCRVAEERAPETDLLEQMDALMFRGEALLDHARVLCVQDRTEDAAASIERALELFETKQSSVLVATARALFADVAVA